jgi:hypothetical protein
MRDLVVLTADKNTQFTLRGGLSRPQALGIRPVSFDFRVHAGRDGGARSSGAEVLRGERRRFLRALLVFDFEGCGAATGQTAAQVEQHLDAELSLVWGSDAKAIVVDPEIEAWIWGTDNALHEVLGWPLQQSIRAWLKLGGHALADNGKPARPKEAFEALVPVHQLPRSSSIYESIAGKISLASCQDGAFLRLRQVLQQWFPPATSA